MNLPIIVVTFHKALTIFCTFYINFENVTRSKLQENYCVVVWLLGA